MENVDKKIERMRRRRIRKSTDKKKGFLRKSIKGKPFWSFVKSSNVGLFDSHHCRKERNIFRDVRRVLECQKLVLKSSQIKLGFNAPPGTVSLFNRLHF